MLVQKKKAMAVYYLTTHTVWCIEVYWKNCLTAERSIKALFSENAAESLHKGIFWVPF